MLNCIIKNLFWTRSKCLNYIKKLLPTYHLLWNDQWSSDYPCTLASQGYLWEKYETKLGRLFFWRFLLIIGVFQVLVWFTLGTWKCLFFLGKDVPFRSTFDWVMKNVLPDTSRIPWRRGGPSARRIRHRNSLTVCRHLSENFKRGFFFSWKTRIQFVTIFSLIRIYLCQRVFFLFWDYFQIWICLSRKIWGL